MDLYRITKIKKVSKLESDIYTALSEKGYLTVKQLSKFIKRPVESVNRSVNTLIKKGFIFSFESHPRKLKALPIEIGMENYLSSIYFQLFDKGALKSYLNKHFSIKIIPNRTTYHRLGKKLFRNAKYEVMTIASGTGDLFPDFFRTIVSKVNKGVSYRIISLNYDKSNKELLKNWVRNGIEVRYKSGENINLVIYDKKILQIGLRVADDSKEKYGFIIKNETLAGFMADFYEFMWRESKRL